MGGRREHRRAAARGSTSRRARGRAGGAGRGRERRTTTTRPRDPTGRGERTRRGAEDRRRRRRRRAAGEGATRRKTRRSPPDRQGPPLPPPLSLHATSRACAAKTPHDRRVAGSRAPNPLERHQNPAGSGARGTARPQPGGKRAAAEGHRGVPRATTGARIPGARPRARHGLGASRPPRQGEALFGGGAGRGRNPRRRGGPRQGAGRTPPPPPPRWGRAANGRRRRPGLDPPTDIARAPSRAARGLGPTPPPHPRRNTPCPKDRLRREEAPKGTAAAKANGLGASPLVRLFPLTGGARPPKASQPPPPAPSQPTPPSHTRSVKRAGGGGRAWGGVGCGADTAGGRGGAPVSALRGTKGTRRPCEDTPAAPPPERETPRGWRLIVKRRSDRRSPGRNPGPQVRSKCR